MVVIVAPVAAPELSLSAALGFVRETGVSGGSHVLARRWARTKESRQRRWPAIDVLCVIAHVCEARLQLTDTRLFTARTAGPLTLDADPRQ